MNTDPMIRHKFSNEDKKILLSCRYHYKTLESGLPIFLSAIDWWDPEQVAEVYDMLKLWKPLSPYEALPLLDATFPDEAVRLYAVERLEILSDDELALYILELVQGLMFEIDHYSPLGEFLLERSLKNPHLVGHELFWQLRSQLHLKASYERFSLIMEQLLMLLGDYRSSLIQEIDVNDRLVLA
jgi:phosphatidylinositol-4,5-bisphosphate 3-kinase